VGFAGKRLEWVHRTLTAVLLEGIDLSQGKRRKRYSLPAARQEEEREKAGKEADAS
jgi:hypothetical protein